MEHIVQFAISIDDNAIVKRVSEHAEKEIIESLKQDVANKIFEVDYYRKKADPTKDRLNYFSEKIIRELFEEHTEVILDKAAALLADKLARSKKGKELLTKLFEKET